MKTIFLTTTLILLPFAQSKASFEEQIEKVMRAAEEANFQVQKAEQDVANANVGVNQAKAAFSPSISYSANIDDDDDFVSHSIDASLNLFDGLDDYYDLKTKKRQKAKQANQLLTTTREVMTRAGKRYLNLIDLKMQELVQNQEVELRQSSLKVMDDRFKRGLVAEGEVLKLNVDALNSKIQLQEAKQRLAVELNNLIGETQIEIDLEGLPLFPTPPESITLNLSQLSEEMNLNSTFYKERKLELEEQTLARKSAEWQVYSPSLSAFYSYNNNSGFGKNGDAYQFDSTIGLSLTLPLFSQLNDYSEYKRSRIREIKSELDLFDTKRSLNLQLGDAITNLQTLLKTIRLQKKTEELATKFYQQSLDRFRLGLISTNDMSFDQQRVTQARLRLSRLTKDYYQQVLDLNLLLGRPLKTTL